MIRQALYARLKPGCLDEYRRLHDEVDREFPELPAAIRDAGILREDVFYLDPIIFVYAEVEDPDAYPRLWKYPVHERFAEALAPLMEPKPDGLPDVRLMEHIWEINLSGEISDQVSR
jgi:L-rhamnose mutarotase